LKANKVNFFVSSVSFVFWYHSPNFLDTPRIYSLKMLPEIERLVDVSYPLLQAEPLRALGYFRSDYVEGGNKASVGTFSPSKRQAQHNDA
jgi:hypothetical protein